MPFLVLIIVFFSSKFAFSFEGNCHNEISTFCVKEKTQIKVLGCLTKLRNKSKECTKGIETFSKLQGPCTLDIANHCTDAKYFRILFAGHCLSKISAKLSSECLIEVQTFNKKHLDEQQKIENAVLPFCREEFKRICPQDLDADGKPKSYRCFRNAFKEAKIKNENCRAAIEELSEALRKKKAGSMSDKNN